MCRALGGYKTATHRFKSFLSSHPPLLLNCVPKITKTRVLFLFCLLVWPLSPTLFYGYSLSLVSKFSHLPCDFLQQPPTAAAMSTAIPSGAAPSSSPGPAATTSSSSSSFLFPQTFSPPSSTTATPSSTSSPAGGSTGGVPSIASSASLYCALLPVIRSLNLISLPTYSIHFPSYSSSPSFCISSYRGTLLRSAAATPPHDGGGHPQWHMDSPSAWFRCLSTASRPFEKACHVGGLSGRGRT